MDEIRETNMGVSITIEKVVGNNPNLYKYNVIWHNAEGNTKIYKFGNRADSLKRWLEHRGFKEYIELI